MLDTSPKAMNAAVLTELGRRLAGRETPVLQISPLDVLVQMRLGQA